MRVSVSCLLSREFHQSILCRFQGRFPKRKRKVQEIHDVCILRTRNIRPHRNLQSPRIPRLGRNRIWQESDHPGGILGKNCTSCRKACISCSNSRGIICTARCNPRRKLHLVHWRGYLRCVQRIRRIPSFYCLLASRTHCNPSHNHYNIYDL
jgi:hypothetical protein